MFVPFFPPWSPPRPPPSSLRAMEYNFSSRMTHCRTTPRPNLLWRRASRSDGPRTRRQDAPTRTPTARTTTTASQWLSLPRRRAARNDSRRTPRQHGPTATTTASQRRIDWSHPAYPSSLRCFFECPLPFPSVSVAAGHFGQAHENYQVGGGQGHGRGPRQAASEDI